MLVRVIRRVLLPVGLLLAALMAGCGTAPRNVSFPLGTADRNLAFCNSQTLDLYVPRAAVTSPLPTAMYVHGGGITAGDKSDLNPVILDALASAGYAVASVNYRLAPQFRFSGSDRGRQVRHQVSASQGTSVRPQRKRDIRIRYQCRRRASCTRCPHRPAFGVRCRTIRDGTEQPDCSSGHIRPGEPHRASIRVLSLRHSASLRQ